MSIMKYEIGGNEVKIEGSEGIADIPQNRTLLVEKLTSETIPNPELITGLETIESVFDHYRPKKEVAFENEQGQTIKETFHFHNTGDFAVNMMTGKSPFLNELNINKEFYANTTRQFRSNKVLMQALNKKESKEAIIDVLEGIRAELKETITSENQ